MKDILYIHIPKTGGVTINNTLIKTGYKNKFGHQFAKTIKHNNPTQFNGCVKFTTVRNPWSRLLSVYTFLTVGSNIHKPPEHIFFDKLGIKSFYEFIKRLYILNKDNNDNYIYHADKNHIVNLYTRQQINWVFDNDGNQLVDYICRLDTLSNDINGFNEKYGFNINLIPPQNLTKHKYYTEMYNNETIDMVEELYIDDINEFGFKYNN
jgi:hypothetical protein